MSLSQLVWKLQPIFNFQDGGRRRLRFQNVASRTQNASFEPSTVAIGRSIWTVHVTAEESWKKIPEKKCGKPPYSRDATGHVIKTKHDVGAK
jgi:hypothetical protein